jgi:hypothetical protein
MGEENVQDFGGKARRKESTWRLRSLWEDGIGMDLREIGWGSVEWIQLAQVRYRWRAVVNTAMNLRVLAPRTDNDITCFIKITLKERQGNIA